MVATEVYPYEDIIEGMPLTHKYGLSFTELTKALAQQLDSFITGTERVQADLSPVNALGPVLDSIGTLLDVTRKAGQSDSTLSNIILNEAITREQTTTDSLITAIHEVIGIDPTIEEYPDVDFINDHGLVRNEGAILITFVMPSPEPLKDITRQTEIYKAAGIAAIYNALSELTFTDEITVLEELFSIMLTVQDEESITTLIDHLDFEMGLTEALISITDALESEAVMYFVDALTDITAYLSLEYDFFFTEDLSVDDYFGGGEIESFMVESLTSITDALRHEGTMNFSDALTTIDDALAIEIPELFFIDALSSLTDYFGGGLIESFMTESLTTFSEELSMEGELYLTEALATITDYLSHEGEIRFSDDLSTLDDVLSQEYDFYFSESLTTLSEELDAIEAAFTEALTDIVDAFSQEGELYLAEALTGWDHGVWDVAEWDDEGMIDYFGGGSIESFMTESMTSLTDDLRYELVAYFTDILTTITDILSLELGDLNFTDILSTITDYFGGGVIESFMVESLTSITEQLSMEGVLYLDEDLPTLDDVLSHEGILYFDDALTTLVDVLGGGLIEYLHTEALTTLSEEFDIERTFAFIEALTTITDDLSHEGEVYFTENLTTLGDVLGGGAIESFLTESMPSRVPRIGTAKIGVDVIGGGWHLLNSGDWDIGYWDSAKWDDTIDKTLAITELF